METVDRRDEALESVGSTGGAVAASTVVICALFLMALPPFVAIVSMFDPGAFDQASLWLKRLSPALSFLDYVKAAATIVALAAFWKSRQATRRERPVRPPYLREVLTSEHRVGVFQGLGGVEAEAARLLR